jgi:nitroreductase
MIVNQVDHRTVRSALELATRAPSVHNSQPWRWRIADRSVHLYADRARRLPATDPDGRDWILSCGAALHHLRIALAASGIAASVRRIPNPSEPDHLAALQLHDRAPDACDIRLATAITARRTDRRRYGPWPVPEVFVAELVQLRPSRAPCWRRSPGPTPGRS